jgi:hypothetical protein
MVRNEKFLYFTNIQRWIELKELFTDEACKLYHINRTPLINNVLQVGISCMKTVYCGQNKCAGQMKTDGGSSAFSKPMLLLSSDKREAGQDKKAADKSKNDFLLND